MDPLKTNAPNRYVQTEWTTQFLKRFKRLLQPLGPRSPEDKAAMLLTAIGEEAALLYDVASDIVTTGNAYEQAMKKIEKLFMVPNPQKEARIRFYSVAPDDEYEKPLVLLDKLRKAAVLCEFERPDQEIMRVLLNKCPDSKFQEKAFLANWDETSLNEAEKFARKLEQSQLAQKRIKSSYGGYKVKKVTMTSCKNCGKFHDAINCPAKGKQCYNCKMYDHFQAFCSRRNNHGNFRGHGRGHSHYRGQYNSGRGQFGGRGRGRGHSRGRGRGRSRGRGRGHSRGRGRGQGQRGYVRQVREDEPLPLTYEQPQQNPVPVSNSGKGQGTLDSFSQGLMNMTI